LVAIPEAAPVRGFVRVFLKEFAFVIEGLLVSRQGFRAVAQPFQDRGEIEARPALVDKVIQAIGMVAAELLPQRKGLAVEGLGLAERSGVSTLSAVSSGNNVALIGSALLFASASSSKRPAPPAPTRACALVCCSLAERDHIVKRSPRALPVSRAPMLVAPCQAETACGRPGVGSRAGRR
jgi:hypothetical protein